MSHQEKLNIEKENDNCIGCGENNPIGLKLKFELKEGTAITHSKLNANYEGYKDIIHGGIITLILDETSAKAISTLSIVAVTGKITVYFKKPLMVGEEFKCEANIVKKDGKRIFVETKLTVGDVLKARSESVFFNINGV